MKTQQEIEKIKDDLGKRISELSSQINRCTIYDDRQFMAEKSRQMQAQYNILLEVLK